MHYLRWWRYGDPLTARNPGAQPGNTNAERHGHSTKTTKTPTYSTWHAMISRCHYPSVNGYKWYGARGITVCDRWRSFQNFLADMGERPKGKTLDRTDPDGNYEPGNCRWVTPKQQRANRSQRSA